MYINLQLTILMQQYHLKIVHVAITCKIHHTGANIKHHSYYKLLKGGMMLGVLICTAISEFHVQISYLKSNFSVQFLFHLQELESKERSPVERSPQGTCKYKKK